MASRKGLALYVAYGAADLDDYDLGLALLGELVYAPLDGVGDVGDRLDGASQELSLSLPGYDVRIYLAGRDVWRSG